VRGYRQLAFAMAQYQIETYDQFDTALANALADGPKEPRYLGRVAMARLLAGDFETAVKARSAIAWFGKNKPEPDPIVTLFDAALLVESGLPSRALDVLGNLKGTRAHIIRAQALLDLGIAENDARRLTDALAEAELAEAGAVKNPEANTLAALLRVLTAPSKTAKEIAAREDLVKALESLARNLVTKRGRHAQGLGLYLIGNTGDARLRLEQALEAVDQANPNPITYRTHTLLARLDLAEGKLDAASTHIEAALKANGGFLPAMIVQAKILLAAGDPENALAAIKPVLAEEEAVTGEVELIHAEALIANKGATAEDRTAAEAAVRRAKDKGAPPVEIGRVASLISADLPLALGVPAPAGAPTEDKDEPKKKPKKRRR
jgi:tetratricopeptide (TPR) repeat protein